MKTVSRIYDYLNERIPSSLSCDWDNDGIMVALDGKKKVTRAVVALDATLSVAREAKRKGAELIVTHHPLLFRPAGALSYADPAQKALLFCLQNGISVFSFHTRLDAMDDGVNDRLADLLGIEKEGREVFCGIGRVGRLKRAVLSKTFVSKTAKLLRDDRTVAVLPREKVQKVALLGGSGKHMLREVIASGADTYVTGEVPYDEELAFFDAGINLIPAGHYFTENPVCEKLKELLKECDPSLNIDVLESNHTNGGFH